MSKGRVAVVDDDPGVRELIRSVLVQAGFEAVCFDGSQSFLGEAGRVPFHLILCDLALPQLSGIEVLRRLRSRGAFPPFVIVTGHASVATAVEAMKEGASDYLVKPFRIQQVVDLAERLVRVPEAEETGGAPPGVVGVSAAWKDLLAKARRVGELSSTVLIRGETGTGKDVLAKYIASFGPRAPKAYVALNCAALPETLIESELFGHVRGAFTGATAPRRGLFEEADGGTLFLDEIGSMPPALQARLLRALEEKQIRRVGDSRSIAVDVRILAATNLDVEAAIARNEFREDLYFRLSVVTLFIPPLRERPDDIPVLSDHFLRLLAPAGASPRRLSPSARSLLAGYAFPGNVRELKHAVEQAVALSSGAELTPDDFSFLRARAELMPERGGGREARAPVEVTPADLESALREVGGNRIEAARRLGISRSTLYRLLRRLPSTETADTDA